MFVMSYLNAAIHGRYTVTMTTGYLGQGIHHIRYKVLSWVNESPQGLQPSKCKFENGLNV